MKIYKKSVALFEPTTVIENWLNFGYYFEIVISCQRNLRNFCRILASVKDIKVNLIDFLRPCQKLQINEDL